MDTDGKVLTIEEVPQEHVDEVSGCLRALSRNPDNQSALYHLLRRAQGDRQMMPGRDVTLLQALGLLNAQWRVPPEVAVVVKSLVWLDREECIHVTPPYLKLVNP